MTIENGNCLHVALFGTFNENRYFLGDYKGSFDLIGFNANVVAYAAEGLAAFVAQLANKAYFIDPLTHAFQHHPTSLMVRKDKEWVLKKSIEKLSQYYGSPFLENAGKTPVSAGSFDRDGFEGICRGVLQFQLKVINDATQNLDVKEFLDDSEQELRPQFLIAPYFYLEPDNLDRELEDNVYFIVKSREILESNSDPETKPLFAEIVLDKEVLFNPVSTKMVIQEYQGSMAEGYLLWIDDFSELSVSEKALKTYLDFTRKLASTGRPIIAMHGSYFSIILSGKAYACLAGVGHGIEYGEHRPVLPVGGGVPLAKFYFPRFYERVNYDPHAEEILLEKNWIEDRTTYLTQVCSCEMCRKVIKDDVASGFHEYGETKISEKDGKAYPTAQAMDKSRRHYLNSKIDEYEFCKISQREEILKRLKQECEIADGIKKSYSFGHLRKWMRVLSG